MLLTVALADNADQPRLGIQRSKQTEEQWIQYISKAENGNH